MTLTNHENTKNVENVSVENIMENYYESNYENPPSHSDTGKIKDVHQTLNSVTFFYMSLVM